MTNTTEGFADLVHAGKLAQNAEAKKKNGALDFPTGEGYIMEPKWDGWRIIAHVVWREVDEDTGEVTGEVNFFSRSGKSYNGKLPKVEAELLSHFPAGTWLDGEVVAIRIENGKMFNEWAIAQSVLTKVSPDAAADKLTYMVFDLLAHRDIDARPLPLVDRRVLLERIFEGADFEAVALTTIHEASADTYAAHVAAGFEGSVAKALNRPYGSGKREGGGWTKVKPKVTIEGVVMGFKPGENGFAGMVGAIIFGQYDEGGNLVERGRCSGMDMRTRQKITAEQDEWLGKVIEIGLVAPLGGAGNPPQYKRLRPDKAAAEVVIHDA